MRARVLTLGLSLGGAFGLTPGCTPEIVSGAYECGPDQACPNDLVCSPVESVCVTRGTEVPFACPSAELVHEPDDTQAAAFSFGVIDCASSPTTIAGCVAAMSDQDWVSFGVKANCPTTTAVSLRLGFPVGEAPLAMTLVDGAGAPLATDVACADATPSAGADARCLTLPVAAGATYGVRIGVADHDTCGGACAYNRYALSVQLRTP
jgi:hypothetical protein